MWGTIDNKQIQKIEESYCLGEACLIFWYDRETRRTIGFKTVKDLKGAQTFLKSNNKNFTSEVIQNKLFIKTSSNEIALTLVNETHAKRFKEVLDNFN